MNHKKVIAMLSTVSAFKPALVSSSKRDSFVRFQGDDKSSKPDVPAPFTVDDEGYLVLDTSTGFKGLKIRSNGHDQVFLGANADGGFVSTSSNKGLLSAGLGTNNDGGYAATFFSNGQKATVIANLPGQEASMSTFKSDGTRLFWLGADSVSGGSQAVFYNAHEQPAALMGMLPSPQYPNGIAGVGAFNLQGNGRLYTPEGVVSVSGIYKTWVPDYPPDDLT